MYLDMLRRGDDATASHDAREAPAAGASGSWSVVLGRLPDTEAFEAFHAKEEGLDGFDFLDDREAPARTRTRPMGDARALLIGEERFGRDWRIVLPLLPQEQRNQAIRQLRTAGLSIRQIERLTGIGRGIVALA